MNSKFNASRKFFKIILKNSCIDFSQRNHKNQQWIEIVNRDISIEF